MRMGSGIIWLALIFVSCSRQTKKELPLVQKLNEKAAFIKPASGSVDTLRVRGKAAVFFQPDSGQLVQLKSTVEAGRFESMMHEYFYQMRNARILLKQQWKELKLVETSKARWLVFEQKTGKSTIIDLDKNNEPCGIYLFNPPDDPLFTDMMNIDTQAGFYFGGNKN